jgi:hypothetical protein
MSHSAKTLLYFSLFYMLPTGFVMLLAPNLPLTIAGLPHEGQLWIRLMGVVVLILAYYYYNLARMDVRNFFRWTVHTRGSITFVFAALAPIFDMPPIVVAFALPDLLGALWTWWGLKKDGHSPFKPI